MIIKIWCSNTEQDRNIICGNIQDPFIDGYICTHCHKLLSGRDMKVVDENNDNQFFINLENNQIALTDAWWKAEELLSSTNIKSANYQEVLKYYN